MSRGRVAASDVLACVIGGAWRAFCRLVGIPRDHVEHRRNLEHRR